jgi:uroporphyrin-III C-methyltransferase
MDCTNSTSGTVSLVGAGPGDPELITVKGQRLLREADVVVYDRLVHRDLVREADPEADLYFVGKAPGEHKVLQAEINALLATKARRGNTVVRLKGGDPFVFGRGGEEAHHLRQSGVDFEVVPGISSATGVPAYAGIPVTHRGRSRAFTVVTGHTIAMDDTSLDWDHLVAVDTLVILMGLRRLPQIAENLIGEGRAADTPVAVISSGTTEDQQVVRGTLDTIEGRLGPLEPPVTIVVGEVAQWGGVLDWFQASGEEAEDFPTQEEIDREEASPGRVPVLPNPAFTA